MRRRSYSCRPSASISALLLWGRSTPSVVHPEHYSKKPSAPALSFSLFARCNVASMRLLIRSLEGGPAPQEVQVDGESTVSELLGQLSSQANKSDARELRHRLVSGAGTAPRSGLTEGGQKFLSTQGLTWWIPADSPGPCAQGRQQQEAPGRGGGGVGAGPSGGPHPGASTQAAARRGERSARASHACAFVCRGAGPGQTGCRQPCLTGLALVGPLV